MRTLTVKALREHLLSLPPELDDYEVVVDHGRELYRLVTWRGEPVPQPAEPRLLPLSVAAPDRFNQTIALEL